MVNGLINESGKRGSNPRLLAWEANALPTELLPQNYECKNTFFFDMRKLQTWKIFFKNTFSAIFKAN